MRLKHSKLTHIQTNKLLEHFVVGTPARTACLLVGVNKITATQFYHRLRGVIAERLAEEAAELAGEIEVDESYFGGVRKGKRGRGAAVKVPVFGLLKRGSRVFVRPVKDTRSDTLIPIIACEVQPDSVVYTDSFRAYDQLDVTDFHHMRINHSKLFADRENHINGIENFWNQAKRHLRRYNGIPRQNFHLLIKECEWRFNYGPPDQLLKTLRVWLKPYAFRDKFERYVSHDRHNAHVRRKAYTAVAAKIARTAHAIVKSGQPYRPFFEGAAQAEGPLSEKSRGGVRRPRR